MKPQAKRNAYELAQQALEARGYLVIGEDRKHATGAVITFDTNSSYGFFCSQLLVLAETDFADMQAQDRLLGLKSAESDFYYRTVAE